MSLVLLEAVLVLAEGLGSLSMSQHWVTHLAPALSHRGEVQLAIHGSRLGQQVKFPSVYGRSHSWAVNLHPPTSHDPPGWKILLWSSHAANQLQRSENSDSTVRIHWQSREDSLIHLECMIEGDGSILFCLASWRKKNWTMYGQVRSHIPTYTSFEYFITPGSWTEQNSICCWRSNGQLLTLTFHTKGCLLLWTTMSIHTKADLSSAETSLLWGPTYRLHQNNCYRWKSTFCFYRSRNQSIPWCLLQLSGFGLVVRFQMQCHPLQHNQAKRQRYPAFAW